MAKQELTEPVFSAKIEQLHRAAALLEAHGIACRHSHPKRESGILRVSPGDAPQARSLLGELEGDVISAAEAALFFCPACQATLSLGAKHCPQCGALVGDPHGM